MSSISQIASQATSLPSRKVRTREKKHCDMLPSMDGKSWGRECEWKKLTVHDQIMHLGRIQDSVLANKKNREQGDPEAFPTEETAFKFYENMWLLVDCCVEPSFDAPEATFWLTTEEHEGMACSDVAQWLLFNIRSLNDEAEGLEDVSAGLQAMRRTPYILQTLEKAYEQGPDVLMLLLEGKVPASQNEIAQYIDKWGDIILHVAMAAFRRRAKIQAEETSEAILSKAIDFLLSAGVVKRSSNG